MFIQTEDTPNPATMKFLPGREVLGSAQPIDIRDEAAAESSPLAQALFTVDGVRGVFLGRDFIAVTRDDRKEWPALKPALLGVIMAHFESGLPVMAKEGTEVKPEKDGVASGGDDDHIVRLIREILDERIRPAVAQDGGDIVFHKYEDGVVYLALRGACAGCPGATATLKGGVENMLRHFIPEVREVRQVR
jgi:Fe-S cluster biogenesis protein NfuA